jgi:hypothetical protein
MRRNKNAALGNCHADRHRDRGLVPEKIILILQSIAIGILQDMNFSIVTQSEQPSVRTESDIVYVGKLHRQFPHRESGYQHVDFLGADNLGQAENEGRNDRSRASAGLHSIYMRNPAIDDNTLFAAEPSLEGHTCQIFGPRPAVLHPAPAVRQFPDQPGLRVSYLPWPVDIPEGT